MTTHTFSINVTTANGREAAREALLIAIAGRNPDGYKFKLAAAMNPAASAVMNPVPRCAFPPVRKERHGAPTPETNPPERPVWVMCIEHTHMKKAGSTWCGRNVPGDWLFSSIDHAAYNALQDGRLVTCSQCWEAIQKAFALPQGLEKGGES